MSEAFSTILAHCGLFVLVCVIGIVIARGKVRWEWLGAALLLFIVEDAALNQLWDLVAVPNLIPGEHAWQGAGLATVLVILVALLFFRRDWAATGLTLAQKGPAPVAAGLATAALLGLTLAAALTLAPQGVSEDPESLVFGATLSPLQQEVFYRGLLLAAFDKAFGSPLRILGAPMGWGAVASAVLFTAAQGEGLVMTPEFTMTMDLGPAAYVFPIVLILTWIRAASGSILMPFAINAWGQTALDVF